jgi:site-specific recombinase XerD
MTVETACERFYAYQEANGSKPATLGKYKLLFDEMRAEFRGRSLESVSVNELREYREGWTIGPVSARGKIGRMRTVFGFCMDSGWIGSNPAKRLKLPKEVFRPKIPYSSEELEKIFWATEVYPKQGRYGERSADRVRAFLLVLRYTGLRIRDVVGLKRTEVADGKVFLYMSKTGLPVWVPVPKEVEDALRSQKTTSSGYFFWSGEGKIKSAVGDWQRALGVVSKLSCVHVFAHRFRTTLAIELLTKGVSVDKVAMILGNSVRICEKHYLPFVKARQDSLTAEVTKAWKLSG